MSTYSFPLRATFLALPLEDEAKRKFQVLQEALKAHSDILSFQNPQSPHLTLYFWPYVLELELDGIRKQAEKIAASVKPFSLQVTHAGTFGARGEDHVLFLEIAFSEHLARLKKACPWPEGREFSPHITLARIRHPQKFCVFKKKIMKALEDCAFTMAVDRLRLYAEVNGVRQTPLQEFLFEK